MAVSVNQSDAANINVRVKFRQLDEVTDFYVTYSLTVLICIVGFVLQLYC